MSELPEPTEDQRMRLVRRLMDDMPDRERESLMQCYMDRFGEDELDLVMEELTEAYRAGAVGKVG